MNLFENLKNIELPEVRVTVNEDVYRNLFLTLFLSGAALMITWVVLKKVSN